MTPVTLRRWRGLKELLEDAVEHGSRAVQQVHTETARRPFAVLEVIPVVGLPARGVHVIHDTTVSAVYGLIRLVNRAVGRAGEVALDLFERGVRPRQPPP